MRKSIPTPTTETPAPDAVALPSISSLPSLPPIPEGWEAKAAMVDQCIGAGKRLTLWIAILVAEGRSDFKDPSDWITSCTERWGWAKPHVHHLGAVGSFLKHANKWPMFHETLMGLDWDKLLSISRLPENLLVPFLEKARPQDHSRDEVRAAVNRWLKAAGEPTDDAPPKPSQHPNTSRTQYDFLDALFAVPTEDVHAFHRRAQERAASVDDALPILNRAFAVVDVMIGRLDRRRPEAFVALAKDFRMQATRLEKLLADPGILSPVRPLSPPPGLSSPEDAVRRRRLPASQQE